MSDVPSGPAESAADIEQELEASAQRLRLDAQAGLTFVKSLLGELTGVASSAVVIIVTVILMLLEAARFPEKLNVILAPDSPARLHVAVILVNIRRYMGIKTATSLLTGALVAGFLWIVGVEDPLLWGLLAFLFNYIPNIGSILAAVPAVLLAFMQFGLPAAVVTAVGYVVINCLISYAIEPRFMGQGLGLSTLVVFVSLVFWGWVLGPMGMLLSAPLTMIAKIIMNNYEDTRWLAVLISARAPEGEKL
jgi:predicted PurR-regulated permease PerM